MSASIDRVIVTGASSGIGFDVARLFLEAGSRVVIYNTDLFKKAGVTGVPTSLSQFVANGKKDKADEWRKNWEAAKQGTSPR